MSCVMYHISDISVIHNKSDVIRYTYINMQMLMQMQYIQSSEINWSLGTGAEPADQWAVPGCKNRLPKHSLFLYLQLVASELKTESFRDWHMRGKEHGCTVHCHGAQHERSKVACFRVGSGSRRGSKSQSERTGVSPRAKHTTAESKSTTTER